MVYKRGRFSIRPICRGFSKGVVASALNRRYTGIDLSANQITENNLQYAEVSEKCKLWNKPEWINGDSTNIDNLVRNKKYNFVFSCPPYYNLEVYSNSAEDLSNKNSYEEFLNAYTQIIKKSCALLGDDSFAVFVVGNRRDKKNRSLL